MSCGSVSKEIGYGQDVQGWIYVIEDGISVCLHHQNVSGVHKVSYTYNVFLSSPIVRVIGPKK